MASYNLCILMGNLTKDPELKYTSSGKAVTNFGLALNCSFKDDKNEKQEEVTFVDIVCLFLSIEKWFSRTFDDR